VKFFKNLTQANSYLPWKRKFISDVNSPACDVLSALYLVEQRPTPSELCVVTKDQIWSVTLRTNGENTRRTIWPEKAPVSVKKILVRVRPVNSEAVNKLDGDVLPEIEMLLDAYSGKLLLIEGLYMGMTLRARN